jgi:hypothetical protein
MGPGSRCRPNRGSSDGRNPVGTGREVADAPAGDAERFGEAGDGDGALGHARQRGEANVALAVEQEVLVNLVRENNKVVLDREAGDGLQFVE